MKAALAMLGATAAALVLARPLEPYTWGHRLTGTCQWRSRAAAQAFGREVPDQAATAAERACWRRHGGRGPSGDVREILGKWPDAAQLAEWNGETP